jgi:hypothetical protein
MRHLIAFALLCSPAACLSQQTDGTVSPGMSRTHVEAALGTPSTVRAVSEFTYLFYPNACGRECGINDLVILRRDSVVDAIFRAPNRHYTGTSSSPSAVRPGTAGNRSAATKPLTVHKDAAPATPATPSNAPTTKPMMKPPAEANDVRPSIPLNQPTLKPAPATTPAPEKKPTS